MKKWKFHKPNWRAVLRALEISPTQPSLPTAAGCPNGPHSFSLVQDNILNEVWHYCFKCDTGGDLIALAAKTWNLAYPEAAQRLQQFGCWSSRSQPPEQEFDRREQLQQIIGQHETWWREHRENLLPNWPIQCDRLFGKSFDARHWVAPTRWKTTVGLGIGWCSQYAPDWQTPVPNQLPSNPSLVYGVYRDQWNRLSGLEYYQVSRRKTAEHGRLYLTPNYAHKPQCYEGGLAGLDYVQQAGREWGDSVFVLASLPDVWRAQIAHAKIHENPLPLVSFQHDTTAVTQVWSLLQGRPLIFWLPVLHGPTVIHAASQDARIAVLGPSTAEQLSRYRQLKFSTSYFRQLRCRAHPWTVAVAIRCRRAEPEALWAFWQALHGYPEIREQILSACDRDTAIRLSDLSREHHTLRSIPVGKYRVELWGDHVLITKQNYRRFVCNGHLVVEFVEPATATTPEHYRGYIGFAGQHHPFRVARSTVENRPLDWMYRYLLQRRAGVFLFNSYYQKQFLLWSLRLHPPQLARLPPT